MPGRLPLLPTLLLLLASPLLLVVGWSLVVSNSIDVAAGLEQAFSRHDVVQIADGTDTAIALVVLLLLAGGLLWLCRVPVPVALAATLVMLLVPIAAVLAAGAEAALDALLSARGYAYCTFHVTGRDRGETGTYVYARTDRPLACPEALRRFPPHRIVPDQRTAVDLPD